MKPSKILDNFGSWWRAGAREQIVYMWPAKVLSLAGAILLYFFISMFGLAQYEVTVPITYILPEGYVQGREFINKTRLVFRGDEKLMDTLKTRGLTDGDFVVLADFSKIKEAGTYRDSLEVRFLVNEGEVSIPGFERADPAEVSILLEKAMTRQVPVFPVLNGKPKEGFELGDYGVIPETVTIIGPEARIANIGSVSTDTVNLTDRDQSFVQKQRVQTGDSLVQISGNDIVTIRVSLRTGQETLVYNNIPLTMIGLSPDLVLKDPLPPGRLRLREIQGSTESLLDAGQNNSPRLLLDGSSLREPGTYQLNIIPEIPPNMEIHELVPRTVNVELLAIPEEPAP